MPTYVYVHRIQPANLAAWKNLRVGVAGEPPDLVVRQAPAPQSVFRGLVRPEGMAACDVLQVWLDVASHPSRGREQADLIRKRVLHRVIEGGPELDDVDSRAKGSQANLRHNTGWRNH